MRLVLPPNIWVNVMYTFLDLHSSLHCEITGSILYGCMIALVVYLWGWCSRSEPNLQALLIHTLFRGIWKRLCNILVPYLSDDYLSILWICWGGLESSICTKFAVDFAVILLIAFTQKKGCLSMLTAMLLFD